MSETLKSKFFTGVMWTFVQNIGLRLLSFAFTVILTRLLTPEEFGLIGMLSIFISISLVFISSGFADALVQKSDCNAEDFSTAFYFNLGVSILFYLILFFSAPLIADFYHEPQLCILTRVLSLNFVLGSLNIVQRAKLAKELNFKPIAIVTVAGTLFSGALGVFLAYNGYGVWALVAQTISSTFIGVVLFPFFSRWKPSRSFNIVSLKYLWNYGSKILATALLEVVVSNISNILIGRFYNKKQVGYFSRAHAMAEIPAGTIFSVLYSVTFPILCECQQDISHQLSVYKRILFNTVLIVCPIIILLALLAKPLVVILFTEKWIACVPLLQALLLARMFLPIGATYNGLLRSRGNTSLFMKLYFVTGPMTLIGIIVSIPFGVEAMAWVTFFCAVVSFIIQSFVVGRYSDYSFINQLKDWRMIGLSLLIMIICIIVVLQLITNMLLQVIVASFLGLTIYLVCCYIFKLIDHELINMVIKRLKK